jgi:hypothetical protein
MKNEVNRAFVAKKISFKTTTLIAAIGMSIAALYFWAEYVMSRWLGMAEVTIVSMPERIARHVFFSIQLLSAAIFFLGVYRYPNQLPKRNRWYIAVLITTLLLLCIESIRVLIGLNTQTFHHPIFFNWYKHVVSILITAVLWFYYAKSENTSVGIVMRSFSLIVSVAFLLCFMYYAGLCAGWYFCLIEYYGVVYDISTFFYWLAHVSAIVWLIAMLISKNPEEKDNNYKDSIRKLATWGTRIGIILFVLYMASFIGCIFIVDIVIMPEWIKDIIYISFLSTPIVSGALLIYAGETLRRACGIIKEQHDTIYLYQKLYPNAKQKIDENSTLHNENTIPTESLTTLHDL